MFKSHVNLFSYIIITILQLQCGTISKYIWTEENWEQIHKNTNSPQSDIKDMKSPSKNVLKVVENIL